MYQVILSAEDGDYVKTGPMSERDAIKWIEKNESSYGEGQELFIQECGNY